MTRNKRKHERVRAKGVDGSYQAGDQTALGLLIENISQGGLFVRTLEPLPLGTPLLLELARPPHRTPIRVKGRVVSAVDTAEAKKRRTTPGMGIRFDPLPDATSEQLLEMLARLALSKPDADGVQMVEAPERTAFDFGFSSLEQFADQESWVVPGAKPPTAPAPKPPPREVAPPLGRGVPAAVAVGDAARLMVQVRGILQQLGEVQAELDARNREIVELKAEVARLRFHHKLS